MFIDPGRLTHPHTTNQTTHTRQQQPHTAMKIIITLGAAASLVASATAFIPHSLPAAKARSAAAATTTTMMAWTPDRAPQTNPLRGGLSADASYDRAANRGGADYMDTDMQNPPAATKWWEAYLPSAEEQAAAAAGFDFSNPEAWLEKAAKGEATVDLNQPTEFTVVEGFTSAGREWPELKKEIKVNA